MFGGVEAHLYLRALRFERRRLMDEVGEVVEGADRKLGLLSPAERFPFNPEGNRRPWRTFPALPWLARMAR